MIDVLHIALGATGLCCAGGWVLQARISRRHSFWRSIWHGLVNDLAAENETLRRKLHRDTPRATNGRFVKKGAE